jgi:hypothetical protein
LFNIFLGYVAVCVQLYCRPTDNKKGQAGKHTHKNQKINERNRTEKHKWKRVNYNHAQEKATKTAKQIHSGI